MKETQEVFGQPKPFSMTDNIRKNLKHKTVEQLIAMHDYLSRWMSLPAEEILLKEICNELIRESISKIIHE